MSNLSDASFPQKDSRDADANQVVQSNTSPRPSKEKKSARTKRKKSRASGSNEHDFLLRNPRARKYKDRLGKTFYVLPRYPYMAPARPSVPSTTKKKEEKKEKKKKGKKLSPRREDRSSSEYSSPRSPDNKDGNAKGDKDNAMHPLDPPPSMHPEDSRSRHSHPCTPVPSARLHTQPRDDALLNSSSYVHDRTSGPADDDGDHMPMDAWHNASDDDSSSARREAMRQQQQNDVDDDDGDDDNGDDDDDDDGDDDDDDDGQDHDNLLSTVRPEHRGKKGLSHAEMAVYGQRPSVAASPSEETEEEIEGAGHEEDGEGAEDVQEELEEEYSGMGDMEHMQRGGHDNVYDYDDAEETEDEEGEYSHGRRRVSMRSGNERRRSLWEHYPPVVSEVAQMLETRGVQPSQLAYASLTSAGKGVVNYLVRKQSVVIGRLESMVDCCIKSEARSVSRRHAKLFWNHRREEWVIECISEKSCVVVNGIPLVLGSGPIPVKSRDLIELGDVAFFFLAATSPVFLINDIPKLEKTIQNIRLQEERAGAEEDRRRNAARLFGTVRNEQSTYAAKRSRHKGVALDRKRKAEDISPHQRMDVERSRKSQLSKKRAKLNLSYSHGRGLDGDERDMRKRRAEYPSARNNRRERNHRAESAWGTDDGGETEEETEKPSGEVSREGNRDDRTADFDPDLPLRDPFISNQNIRAKQSGGEADGEDGDDFDSAKHREEWNKKERSDFCRALFAVGVDPIFAADGSTETYDWTRFRKIAELPKKSDLMLEDYYIQMMGDVRSLLEEEEREKRTKGPRTKHKPGCDCVVCENTRKSRRKKREQREGSNVEGGSDLDEDVDVKSTAKTSDKLVGLVTAQKLRVRLSIHEAARNVKSSAGESVFEKLEQQKDLRIRDFPLWWRCGYHDRALMRGTFIHGVGQWTDIWNDPRLKPFRKAKERNGSSIEWPSNQAAMKRVREISSSINAELRRKAKRAAKEERAVEYTRSADLSTHGKAKRAAANINTVDDKGRTFSRARKGGKRSSNGPGEGYEAVHDTFVDDGHQDDVEMSDESGLPQLSKGTDASQIETEDEDEVEVEVEEMEIEEEEEEEEDEQGQSDNEVGVDSAKGQVAAKQPAVSVADISTDEEEDEDNIQYETASDSATD